MNNIYLDNAATTCMRDCVIEKITEVMSHCYGNPSSTHSFGRQAKSSVEKARKTIAKIINAKPSEIIFTSGGTEADNMILQGAVNHLGVETIITSKIEHKAVLLPIEAMVKFRNIKVHYVNLLVNGNIDFEHLEVLLKSDDSKKIISLAHVNNEIGNIIDLDKLTILCQKYNTLFHSDTVQSIGHFEWDVEKTQIDFLAASGHKFHGPKGIGFAYIRKNTGFQSLIWGGGQERGIRAGTESVHNIIGLEEAMVVAYENLDAERKHILEIKSHFISELKSLFPNVSFNGHSGDLENSTYTLVNACLQDIPKDKALMLQFHLDLKGIACSKGSACQSGSTSGSHVLSEILPKKLLEKPSIRFSFSSYTTKEDINKTIYVLKEFMRT